MPASAAAMNSQSRIFFVTSTTFNRAPIFREQKAARLFLEVMFTYRDDGLFFIHEFVLMPDHCHLIITLSKTFSGACVPTSKGRVLIPLRQGRQFEEGGFGSAASHCIGLPIYPITHNIENTYCKILCAPGWSHKRITMPILPPVLSSKRTKLLNLQRLKATLY